MPGGLMSMDKRRALTALLLLSLGSCSRHEHLMPVSYSPSPSSDSDIAIRTAIVQQSISSYRGICPCPYSGPTCQGHSAYENPGNQAVYCYEMGYSDIAIRTAIVQQSISSYRGICPCPYSGPTCQGHSTYENPGNQAVYCYTKDVPTAIVSSYQSTSRSSNGEASADAPLPITAPPPKAGGPTQ